MRAQLALEETFGCGVGGCWGCVVPLISRSAQAPSFPPAERGGSDVVYAPSLQRGSGFLVGRVTMVSVRPSLATKIGKLELAYPTLMGSGCYGSGEEYAPFADLSKIGAIVLKSVTRLPRLGNATPRLVHTPAGMLNAIGLQNPGIDWYLERELHKYAGRPCKIVGSVAGFSIDDYAYVCERLAARDEIAGRRAQRFVPERRERRGDLRLRAPA